jgi:hypothetical protein
MNAKVRRRDFIAVLGGGCMAARGAGAAIADAGDRIPRQWLS